MTKHQEKFITQKKEENLRRRERKEEIRAAAKD